MINFKRILVILGSTVVFFLALVGCAQRSLLYFPTHEPVHNPAAPLGLSSWQIHGEDRGYQHMVAHPKKIWFFLHGNGGQAGHRDYVLPKIPAQDSLFILEYPGYGARPGKPSRATFDQAAREAYTWLVGEFGVEQIIVLGESLGSGPAAQLADAPIPPQHIVLVVPFDILKNVAQEKFKFLPVGLILLDRWDNIQALKNYRGKLDIFGGTHDPVIPVSHARNLAASRPQAKYHEFSGGHNWADGDFVDLSKL